MNTAGRIPPACNAPASRRAAHAPGRTPVRPSAVILVVALSLGFSVSATRVAQADWFSSSDTSKTKAKRTVKKAGMLQGSTKKPTSATSRMFESMTSGPNKLMANSMSALLPGKKPASTKSRTVPRKLVSEQQPSMLEKLFTPQPKKPLTVTEWISQPRPKP